MLYICKLCWRHKNKYFYTRFSTRLCAAWNVYKNRICIIKKHTESIINERKFHKASQASFLKRNKTLGFANGIENTRLNAA